MYHQVKLFLSTHLKDVFNCGLAASDLFHMFTQSSKFYGKIRVCFCRNTGKRSFILKSTERTYVLLKTILETFKIALRLRDRHVFERQSVNILNVFNTLTLKNFFWKTNLFQKTGVPFY